MTPLQRYGRALRRALDRRERTAWWLANELGLSRSYVYNMRRGDVLPRMGTSAAIAEALDADDLHRIVTTARTRTCPICDAVFVSDAKRWDQRRYCGETCSRAARHRQAKGYRDRATGRRLQIYRDRLDRHQFAVRRHCEECEPMKVCRTADCPLRPVSPLPLVEERVA